MSSSGFRIINVNSTTTGLTDIYPVGYASLGESTFEPNLATYNTFQYAGIVSYSRGNHSIKGGLSLIRRQLNNVGAGYYPVGISFFVYVPGLPFITTNAMANVLLGLSTVAQRQNNLAAARLRTWEPSGFLQDDWRITPKVTLNLGLRYDVFTAEHDASNNLANLDLATSTMIVASNSNPAVSVGTDFKDVAPRFGVSVAVAKNTVLHGAFGLSFFPADTQNTWSYSNPPFLSSFGQSYLVPLGGIPAPSAPDLSNLSGSLYAKALTFPSSYMEEFNVNVQQQLGHSVLTVAYVGVLGRRLSLGGAYNINLPAPSPLPNPASRAPYASTLPNASAIDYIVPKGASSYNGLQVSFVRQFSHGWSMNANYTWSHSLDDIPGSSYSPSPFGLLPNQVSTYDYGNSDLDLRNRFAIGATYAFPFTSSYTGFKGAILKGWQMNGIAFWQGGQPFTVTNSNPQINLGPTVTVDRPDRIGSGHLANHNIAEWFNTDDFIPQAFGTAGSSGKNILTSPHQRRVDLSLFRDFPLFETGTTLQFRAEAYNVSNTPTFDAPNAGIGTPGYGSISDTLPGIGPRIYQFALKLNFWGDAQ